MVTVKPKTFVTMKLAGKGVTHARTDVSVRDLTLTIDEPAERGGTNKGPSPTETLISALVACTNVVSNRIAEHMGLEVRDMTIDAAADFDRRGVMLQEAVRVPFPKIDLTINTKIKGSDEQIEKLKEDLAKFCPLSMVIRQSGTEINEIWNIERL
jgi:putative redox protein